MKWFPGGWLIAGAVALGAAGSGSIWWHGFQSGKTNAAKAYQEVLEDERRKQALLVDQLEEARRERQIEYRDRVQVVYREVDPTGCADINAPDGVLDASGYSGD